MGLALSGGINTFGEFDGSTRGNICYGVAVFLLQAGWQLTEKVKAFVTSASLNPVNGTGYNIGGLEYNFVTTINNAIPRQVLVGANAIASVGNLAAAVNVGGGAGTNYSRSTIVHPTCTAASTGDTITISFKWGGPGGSGTFTSFGDLLGGGFKLHGQSPQLQAADPSKQLETILYVCDNQQTQGGTPLTSFFMISAAHPTLISNEKFVSAHSGRKYRIIACQCQFFVYVEGVDIDNTGSVVCGGIPWVPGAGVCGGEVPSVPVNDVWWISNDYATYGCPRTMVNVNNRIMDTSILVGDGNQDTGIAPNGPGTNGWDRSDGQINGVVTLGSQAAATNGCVRLVSPTPSDAYGSRASGGLAGTGLVMSIQWVAGAQFKLEPTIAWNPVSNVGTPEIQGTLYDAWVITAQSNMDAPSFFDGSWWIAFTDRYKFGTLWLLVPQLTPAQLTNYQVSYAF